MAASRRGASRRRSKAGTKVVESEVEPIDESVPTPPTLVDATTTTTTPDDNGEDEHDQEGDNVDGESNDDAVEKIEPRVTPATATITTTSTTRTAPAAAGGAKAVKQSHSKEIGNGLTALIPGYVAPMALDTSALDPYKATLAELTRRAQHTDLATKKLSTVVSKSSSASSLSLSSSGTRRTNFVPSTYAAYSFKLGQKKAPDLSAGKGWFSMMSCDITDQIKTDMQVIRNRTYLNPKTFYKRADKFGTHVQVGTVIEGSAEFYSSRLTNKERRSDLTQEIMADPDTASYVKRKFTTLQQDRQAVTEHFQKQTRKKIVKKGRRGL